MLRTALTPAASIALCACAPTSLKTTAPPNSFGAPTAATAPAEAGARAADPREVMVDSAMSMLGQPYRWGGAAPGGFDCSGLVVYAAAGAGVHVPRTALEQFDSGRRVPRGQLRMGDLIFMHLAHKELHVGIAIDNDRFIHAPSTGGHVRIDSLDAPPYAKGFIAGRRIIAAP